MSDFHDVSGRWPSLVGSALIIFLVFTVGLYAYRIYFSPLAKFPGPKIAAASLWYETYFDLVKGGQLPWKTQELHEKYGPVVRINPREIHVRDSDYLDKLFSQRLDKDSWFSQTFNVPMSGFGTASAELHRQRRGALNRFFSKSSISSRGRVIQDKIDKLSEKLRAYHSTGEVIHLDAAFICLTVDIISELGFGAGFDYLDVPGFDRSWKALIKNAFGASALTRSFPWTLPLMNILPPWLLKILLPRIAGIYGIRDVVRTQIMKVLERRKTERDHTLVQENLETKDFDKLDAEPTTKATIYDQILDSPLPEAEKQIERLIQEGQVLMSAGSETTGRALYVAAVHLLENPKILQRLREDLAAVMPSPTTKPTWAQLEQVPYLTALIKESLRHGGSVSTRLARISPKTRPIQYGEYTFPPGTPVSVTPFDVLNDPQIFPEPQKYDPTRWLHKDVDSNGRETFTTNASMDRYMVAFSKGPRQCAGMWLAYAELYMTIAQIFQQFDFELYHTDVSDVAGVMDRFTQFAKDDSEGVRVKVVGLREM